MESVEAYLAELRKGRCTPEMECARCPLTRIANEKHTWLHCVTPADRMRSADVAAALLATEAFNV